MAPLSTSSGGISPETYCNDVGHWLSIGWEPCVPSTVEELHAGLERWTEYARRWRPSEADCVRLGIDPTIGRPVTPMAEREQERLLITLRDDVEFRLAFRALLVGGTVE